MDERILWMDESENGWIRIFKCTLVVNELGELRTGKFMNKNL